MRAEGMGSRVAGLGLVSHRGVRARVESSRSRHAAACGAMGVCDASEPLLSLGALTLCDDGDDQGGGQESWGAGTGVDDDAVIA